MAAAIPAIVLRNGTRIDDVLGMAMALCALGDTPKDAFALTAAA